ncbi:unnamed protein product [Candida verbasci]|uniref:LDB19 N-terminal domain-containing protein n=1 Tax=Candida verbasci TaxID=1227364 RepID=A0A9W4TU05_9ASCO|nr:unnamed protein product [Candida verbasci]
MAFFKVFQNQNSHKRPSPTSAPRSPLNITPVSSTISTKSLTPSSTTSPAKKSLASASFSLTITLESPPIILYGNASESTGSIISGILTLSTLDALNLNNVTLSLIQTMRYTKPFLIPNASSISNCKECTKKICELARWDVLTSNVSFPAGKHEYPFSHLIPGNLPASSKLGSSNSHSFIKYEIIAIAKGEECERKLVLPINITRSILRGPDRNSLRVFPPTEVTASAVLPNVIYPKSVFPIELKLDNMVSNSQLRRWRMRKLSWRIEENIKIRANSCEKHISKLQTIEKSYQKISSKKESNKTSNLHHSTIQTNCSLMNNPSTQFNQNYNVSENPQEQDDILIETGEHDIEETIRSAPANAAQNFIEDFMSPNETNTNTLTATPQQSQVQLPIENEKHLYLEETRTISYGDIKSGWKSDFSGKGTIELVANISASGFSTGLKNNITKISTNDQQIVEDASKNGANVSCDIDDPTLGVLVNHTLIVEIVVAEEIAHSVDKKSNGLTPISSNQDSKTSSTGVPTGAARVLRMQFKLPVTERSGLGIAWNDEVPPTYEDIKTLSPPTYQDQGSSTPTPLIGGIDRPQPSLLYGIGRTPISNSFGTPSIDGLVEEQAIQEFRL